MTTCLMKYDANKNKNNDDDYHHHDHEYYHQYYCHYQHYRHGIQHEVPDKKYLNLQQH